MFRNCTKLLLILGLAGGITPGKSERTTLCLDGEWQIAQGTMEQVPSTFEHRVPVPGLVDLAKPAFEEVGSTNKLREAFWYRRTFELKGAVPEIANLKLHKAAYGARVYLNGVVVGEHLPSFTPGYFDVAKVLRGFGTRNELIVRVGASRDSVPSSIPAGWDFEKQRYIPGIFDSVELILSSTPFIVRVQAVPIITNNSLRVQALIRHSGSLSASRVSFTVREARSGKVVGGARTPVVAFDKGEEKLIEARIPIANCRLWSPEDPFLYELETTTSGDSYTTRVGMREFYFDQKTGRAMLNGRPRYLRGSNVTLYRFFEDEARGDLPWREAWVRKLHQKFKEMHWDSLRYCIGFPPEMWYRIADEEGFLIQDEYPLWHLSGQRYQDTWPTNLNRVQLAKEYAEWMQERWNHPCVVIWDAQNETVTEETGPAIQQVRAMDLSNRPWDNGWAPAQAPGDCFESHPYLFSNPKFKLADLAGVPGVPKGNVIPNKGSNAVILNEYGWLWLNRDGTPTTLTQKVYENLLGANAAPAQRRYLYARYLAALTEFWRCNRACAGVLHFCGLGYSRPDGQTSDHFVDVENLTFEPEFYQFVRDAFAPVGLMIGEWAASLPGGKEHSFPVKVINDLENAWKGTVRFRLLAGMEILQEQNQSCEVPSLGDASVSFKCVLPAEPGQYRVEAMLLDDARLPERTSGKGSERLLAPAPRAGVRSLRDFEVLADASSKTTTGAAPGKPATELIGVYDSRAVAYAWFWTEDHQRKLNALMESAKQAKEKGDTAEFNKLDKALKEQQKKMHRQVFSTAPADEAMASLQGRIPEIQKESGVSALISKWDAEALKKRESARQTNITDLLVREFKPGEKQLRVIKDMLSKQPVPLEEADKIENQ